MNNMMLVTFVLTNSLIYSTSYLLYNMYYLYNYLMIKNILPQIKKKGIHKNTYFYELYNIKIE
jgi:hypothetical protein